MMVILFCLFLKCQKLVYNKVVAQCGFFVGGIDETLARKNWANQFSLCLSCVRKFEKVSFDSSRRLVTKFSLSPASLRQIH